MAMPMTDEEFDRFSNAKAESDPEWFEQQYLYHQERDVLVQFLAATTDPTLEHTTIESVAKRLYRADRLLTLDEVEMTVRINWEYDFLNPQITTRELIIDQLARVKNEIAIILMTRERPQNADDVRAIMDHTNPEDELSGMVCDLMGFKWEEGLDDE